MTNLYIYMLLAALACCVVAQPLSPSWNSTSTPSFLPTNSTTPASVGVLEFYSPSGTILLRSDTALLRLQVDADCLYLNNTLLGCAAPPDQGEGEPERSFEMLKTVMIAAGVGSLCLIIGCVVGMFAMKRRMQSTAYHPVEELKQ